MGSLPDSRRVQLFSKPQHTQASSTSSDPREKRRLDTSSKDSSRQLATVNRMPAHRRGLMASPNNSRAISAVATISKLLSSEALAAVVARSPSIRQMGAAISSTIMAAVQGSSRRVRRISRPWLPRRRRISAMAAMPAPAPTYKSPAISVGGTSASSSLDSGALTAYSAAASSASAMPLCMGFIPISPYSISIAAHSARTISSSARAGWLSLACPGRKGTWMNPTRTAVSW